MSQVVVPDMPTAHRQFQEEEDRQRGEMPQYTDEVYLIPSHTARDKKLSVAALLCFIPFTGLFGAHHFYLRRSFYGIVYACTLGLFGLGWFIDWCRIGALVRRCNVDTSEARAKGHWIHSKKYPGYLAEKSLLDAIILWLPPFGIFGLYHFYLGRKEYGKFHACSVGFLLFGWLMDIFRLAYMVEKANTDIKLMKKGTRVGVDPYTVSDAYHMAFPLGFLGLHHFYLGKRSRGIIYLCTFGLFGLGWLTDFIQMPLLVKEANKQRELRERLQNALNNGGQPQDNVIAMTTIPTTNQEFMLGQTPLAGATVNLPDERPPAYSENATAGETVIHENNPGHSAGPSAAEQDATHAPSIPTKQQIQ